MMVMPVEILGRRLVCENQKFHVYFDHVADRAGFEVENYLVVEPKHRKDGMVTGVAVLPIVENRIGLVRIYRPALRDFSWEIPHGFAEEGESEFASAVRELAEETGLEFDAVKSMGCITPDSGILAARVHLYLAKGVMGQGRQVGEIGLREFKLFDIEEFERMIARSEVQDSFTLSAWCKYRLLSASRE
jgi:ADP-ribose pyrophosphatase